jgi:hypothetical protein
MPWKETRVMDERMRFIGAVIEDPRGNFTRLCARFGVSRAKGYKWLARYRELGPAGLEDRKPVALTCPHRTPDEVVDRVVALRKQFPFDGPKKLRARLRVIEGPKFAVPAASTIGEILDRVTTGPVGSHFHRYHRLPEHQPVARRRTSPCGRRREIESSRALQ